MIHSSATSSDPSHLIKVANAPLLNWNTVPVPPVDIQPNSDVYPISFSLVVPPYSDVVKTSFDEVLNVVFLTIKLTNILSILLCLTLIVLILIKLLMKMILQMNNS